MIQTINKEKDIHRVVNFCKCGKVDILFIGTYEQCEFFLKKNSVYG